MNNNKFKFKFLTCFTLVILIPFFFTQFSFVSAYEQVPAAGVAINGQKVDSIDPIDIDGEYYVPLIYFSRILSYNDIHFKEDTKTYEVTDGSTTVQLTMGDSRATKGDEYINIDPPRWINETGYITLNAASGLFNSYIYFKPENGSIQVEKPATKYEVQQEDTLWMIAQAHHTTISDIKYANDLTSNIISRGQTLKLPPRQVTKEMKPVKEKTPVVDNSPPVKETLRKAIIDEAKNYIGAGYKFGATADEAPDLFDCSSFVQFIFGNNDISLPRNSRQQSAEGMAIDVANLEPGDLLFFTNPSIYSDGRVGHNGIYMGNGDMIHASSLGGVHIADNFMDIGYWQENYLFSKRVIN